MTVGKWDAEAWHRQSRREPPAPSNKKPWVYVAVAAFVLTAAGVSATQAFEGGSLIGVCHATADGYVFLPVSKDGFEHGHHRHHAADYFVAANQGGCASAGGAEQNTTDEGAVDPDLPGDVNATEPVTDLPADDTDAVNGTEEAVEETNETIEEAPAPLGDVAVIQTADQDDKKVRLSLLVRNIGDGNASDVSLADDLPDLRRSWSLSGADAKSCVLNGAALRCWFGDLMPGESREVTLSAYTDRMPCGDGMTNTVLVGSADDAEERNNASSASILARYC